MVRTLIPLGYALSMLLSMMVVNEPSAFSMNVGRPMRNMFHTVFHFNFILARFMLTSCFFTINTRIMYAQATNCPMIVAIAAPATPMLRHFMPQNSSKMKIGSSMILTIAPRA